MDLSRARRMRGLSAWFRSEAGLAWLPLVMAIAVIGGVFAWQAYRSEEQRAERAASRLADAVAQDIGRSMEQLDLILRTVMGGERTPASPGLTQEQRNTILFERVPRDRYIGFLDVLDAEGDVLASLRPGEPLSNWASREYFQALRDNPMKDIFAGAPFSTESESAVGFTVSRRITANDGRFAGVVVMGVRLAAVRELLN